MRFLVTADWDNNAPHLTPAARTDLWNSIPNYQKNARAKGIPQLGAGVIFPVPEEDIVVDPFAIPDHWPRGYGLDVGWNKTAAIWGALDIDAPAPITYWYDEYYKSEENPKVHGQAIRDRGAWIPGRIDPAARGRNQVDGLKLLGMYRKAIYGEEDLSVGVLLLGIANNAVETGLYEMLMAQQNGTWKVFRNRCPNWLAERRLYRRDEKGQVIKKRDHAIDASRYRFMSGVGWLVAKPKPVAVDSLARFSGGSGSVELGWMR